MRRSPPVNLMLRRDPAGFSRWDWQAGRRDLEPQGQHLCGRKANQPRPTVVSAVASSASESNPSATAPSPGEQSNCPIRDAGRSIDELFCRQAPSARAACRARAPTWRTSRSPVEPRALGSPRRLRLTFPRGAWAIPITRRRGLKRKWSREACDRVKSPSGAQARQHPARRHRPRSLGHRGPHAAGHDMGTLIRRIGGGLVSGNCRYWSLASSGGRDFSYCICGRTASVGPVGTVAPHRQSADPSAAPEQAADQGTRENIVGGSRVSAPRSRRRRSPAGSAAAPPLSRSSEVPSARPAGGTSARLHEQVHTDLDQSASTVTRTC